MTAPELPDTGTEPAETQLLRDLRSSEFSVGVDAKMWRLVNYAWPIIDVAITAGDGNELGMRINCEDYPRVAPAGRPWDLAGACPLPYELWPRGATAAAVFKPDWAREYGDAPYMACDRGGLKAHAEWATAHPDRAWNSSRTISFYVAEVWRELRGAVLPKPDNEAA
jgi:hypothetical protein